MLNRRVKFAASSVLIISALTSPAAMAHGIGDVWATPSDGSTDVTVEARETEMLSGGSSRSVGERTCSYQGLTIPCSSPDGTWSQTRQCWVQRADPPPARPADIGDPDDSAEDWVAYWCHPPYSTDPERVVRTGLSFVFWVNGGAPELIDPVVLAERAVEQMELVAPRIGMTPLEPGAPMLVGMDMWLWLADSGPQAYGPITRTATAGTTSVTARARVDRVTWDMGDGSTVTCRNPGDPWTPQRGTGASPSCGYRYLTPSVGEPDGAFEVRASTHWTVDWDGAGQSGRLTFTLTSTRDLPVTELQVLNTR